MEILKNMMHWKTETQLAFGNLFLEFETNNF